MKLVLVFELMLSIVMAISDLPDGKRLMLEEQIAQREIQLLEQEIMTFENEISSLEKEISGIEDLEKLSVLFYESPSLKPHERIVLISRTLSHGLHVFQNRLEISRLATDRKWAEQKKEGAESLLESTKAESRRLLSADFEMNNEGDHNPQALARTRIPLNAGGQNEKSSFVKACPFPVRQKQPSALSRRLELPLDGAISAGTWAYPGGGMHLGLDVAAPMYSEVRMPADGVILYADHPVASDGGYLGNWSGWPNGGGNTICVLCPTEQGLFAISFAHLSNRFYVSAGASVSQGQVIALSGHSGNSTGPHCHIEVFELSCSFEEAQDYFASSADFAWGCGFSSPATCSDLGCRIRPEMVFDLD